MNLLIVKYMANKKKVRQYGTQKVTYGDGVVFSYKKKTRPGFDVWINKAVNPTIYRRIGASSTLLYQTGKDGRFRPCEHSTEEYLPNPVPRVVQTANPLSPGDTYLYGLVTGVLERNHGLYYNKFTEAVGSASTPADTIQWNTLGQQALDSMLPSFGGDNSLLNFVLELRDFRKLAAGLCVKSIDWLKIVEEAIGYKKRKSYLANLSRSYLSYNFAWAPLFRDLTELVSSLWNLNKRFELIKKQANTDLQKHYRIVVNGTSSNESTYYSTGDIGPTGGWVGNATVHTGHRVILGPCDGVAYNATLRYRYPLPPEMAAFGGKLRAFLDVLGLNWNPSIIWNAIPFSFVVDWVVNVGRWLSQSRLDNVSFQTQIRDFCHSAVITRTIRYESRFSNIFYSGSTKNEVYSDWSITDVCRKRRYVRKTGIPDFLSSMETSGLNWKEFSLAGALASAGANSRWH